MLIETVKLAIKLNLLLCTREESKNCNFEKKRKEIYFKYNFV